MRFLDPAKVAFRQELEDSQKRSEDERIMQAFRNGTVLGIMLGTVLASAGWIAFFWSVWLSIVLVR